LALLFTGNAAMAQPGKAKFNEGKKSLDNGQIDAAIASFEEAIKLEPTNYKYYFFKAKAEMKPKPPRYDAAKLSLENAVRVNKNFSGGYATLAKIYTREQNYEKAVENYNRAYDVEGDMSKKLNYKLSACKLYLSKMNQPSKAMSELSALESSFPGDARIMTLKGDAYGAQNQWQQALDQYQAAISKFKSTSQESGRDGIQATLGLGVAYYKTGNMAKFEEIKNILKGYNEKYVKILDSKAKGGGSVGKEVALASSYFNAGAYDEALQWVNKGLESNKSSTGYALQGRIYQKTGQLTQAASSFSRAAELENDPIRKKKLLASLVTIQYNSRDYSSAASSAERYLQLEPKDYKVMLIKAQALLKQGQAGAALQAAELGKANAPQDAVRQAQFDFTIGLAAKKAGDSAKARTAFANAEKVTKFKRAAIEESKSLAK
jgi:tetratricopeptide (TPR) repeat protein